MTRCNQMLTCHRPAALVLVALIAAMLMYVSPRAVHSNDFSTNQAFDSCGTVIVDKLYYCYLFLADVDDKIYAVPGIEQYAYNPGDRLRVQGMAEESAGFCTLHGQINDPTISECDEDACPADFTGDGNVGVGDLLFLLGEWGECGYPCPADLTGDGSVGVGDLLILLGDWGPCA